MVLYSAALIDLCVHSAVAPACCAYNIKQCILPHLWRHFTSQLSTRAGRYWTTHSTDMAHCLLTFLPGNADLLPDNPYDTMSQGCDFARNHASPHIDFATIHCWPDSWLAQATDERRLQFARRWINCHVDVCQQLLQKPLVLAEFGWKLDGRAAYYNKVNLSTVIDHVQLVALLVSCTR